MKKYLSLPEMEENGERIKIAPFEIEFVNVSFCYPGQEKRPLLSCYCVSTSRQKGKFYSMAKIFVKFHMNRVNYLVWFSRLIFCLPNWREDMIDISNKSIDIPLYI